MKHRVTIETRDVRRTNKRIDQRWSCTCGAASGDKWTTSEVAHATADAHLSSVPPASRFRSSGPRKHPGEK